MGRLVVVTGAFGYSGRWVTERLLARGDTVRTLTGRSADDSPFGDRVLAVKYAFDEPIRMQEAMKDADVLVNTYWIRFEHRDATFEKAIANSRRLFAAAKKAGVGRIVHVSITNPSEDSELPYFRGKAIVERALAESGVPHTIIRPTVLFGGEDVLLNNIAWLLRNRKVFGVPGKGDYGIQPVHVEDLAELIDHATDETENRTIDAVGPETFEFLKLVKWIARVIEVDTKIWRVPPWVVSFAAKRLGRKLGDVVLTNDEIKGLMAGLLVSEENSTGEIRLTDWIEDVADTLGRKYASELSRHWRPTSVV